MRGLGRLIPRSLHGRMLALSVLATLVALAIAGAAIAGVLQRFVTQGLDQRLDAELSLLAGAVGDDGQIDRARLTRLRGLLDAGPEWRWRIEAPTGTIGSSDFPVLGGPGPHREGGPDREGARGPRPLEGSDGLHARQITVQTTAGPVMLLAAAPRDVVARPIRAAILPLLAMLAILGIVLGVATLVQLRIGLRPLRALRDGVAAMRGGAAGVSEEQPDELRPLAIELNALARDTAAALATARASAANLAHALKTPVATLALGLRDQPEQAAQVARIDATIRHHLARARSVAVDRRARTMLAPAIDDLARTVMRLRGERGVTVAAAIDPVLSVAINAADLDELAGNLIDNAARHAQSAVRVSAVVEGGMVRLSVVDDGPGIAAEDRHRATAPGVRLDEREDGHGFGLAIARELAELHGGRLILDAAPGGGLAASVTLPIGVGGA